MSFILQPAVGGGTISMTAAGTISAGQPVIATAAGTAAQVGVSGAGTSLVVANNLTGPGTSFGSWMAYMAAQTCYVGVNGTQVAASVYGAAGFSTGTPVTYSALSANSTIIVLPGTSTFIIYYRNPTTTYPTVVAGTVNGTTITLGTPVVVSSTAISTNIVTQPWPVDGTRFLGSFNNVNFDAGIYSYCASVSGTTITVGTVTFTADPNGANSGRPWPMWDSAKSAALFIFSSFSGSSITAYVAATLSGTTLTYGTAANISGWTGLDQVGGSNIIYDTLRSQTIIYSRLAVGRGLVAITVTGTVASQTTVRQDFGYTFANMVYNTAANLIIVNFNSDAYTVTNTGSVMTFNAVASGGINGGSVLLVYDSVLNQIVGNGSTTVGIAKVGATNLGTGNYVGIAQNAASLGGTVTINVIGSTASISGLTPGSNYGVLSIGGIAPVTSLTLGQYAGIATTNATLLLKG